MRDSVRRAAHHVEGHRLPLFQALAQGQQLRLGLQPVDLGQQRQRLVAAIQLRQDLDAGGQAHQVATGLGLHDQAVGGLIVARQRPGQRQVIVHDGGQVRIRGHRLERRYGVGGASRTQQRPGTDGAVHQVLVQRDVRRMGRVDQVDHALPVLGPDQLCAAQKAGQFRGTILVEQPFGHGHRLIDIARRCQRDQRAVLQIDVLRILRRRHDEIARRRAKVVLDGRHAGGKIGAGQAADLRGLLRRLRFGRAVLRQSRQGGSRRQRSQHGKTQQGSKGAGLGQGRHFRKSHLRCPQA